MPESEGERILRDGIAALDLKFNDAQISQLLHYLDLLLHWNNAYNLIAQAPYPILVARHLLDSLAILPWLRGASAVDMGTGAGLPGVPLALAEPDRRWWLVDSAGKRIRFLRHVVRELKLAQVTPMASRMEAWQAPPAVTEQAAAPAQAPVPEIIILRAVTVPGQALNWVRHVLVPGSALYLMLGRLPEDDLRHLPPGFRLRALEPIVVPFLEGERHLAIIEPAPAHTGPGSGSVPAGPASNH